MNSLLKVLIFISLLPIWLIPGIIIGHLIYWYKLGKEILDEEKERS